MSEMLDNSLAKDLLTLALDDGFLSSDLKLPVPSRFGRSTSFFAPSARCPPSPPPPSHSLSGEPAEGWPSDIGGGLWSSDNVWRRGWGSASKPDRSLSLSEPCPVPQVAPPPGFPPCPAVPPVSLSSNRYKTELCRGFQETGSCKYGAKCQFAHGEAELRGLYRHPKYKTEPCRTFYNFGYCPYGARCHFIHEDKLGGKLPRQTRPQQPRPALRQSFSFAGFAGASRGSPPLSFAPALGEANLGFSRAPSVSPPPADLLSPVFAESAAKFHFGGPVARGGDVVLEPRPPRCTCGHGNSLSVFPGAEDGVPLPLQRFSSEDSLEDYSSSSGRSSGAESPTFDAAKRLTVFERLSLSD